MGERNTGRRNPANRQGNKDPALRGAKSKMSQSLSAEAARRLATTHSIPSHLRRLVNEIRGLITYVLDANVLMSAWDALFEFNEHEVCIVSQVWRELDKHKTGMTDKAWNARKAIRVIDALVAKKTPKELEVGIPLIPPPEIANGRPHTGKLIFDFSKPMVSETCAVDLSPDEPDDRIIMVCLALKAKGKHVVLISNDGNCRVRANIAGIEAEAHLAIAATPVISDEDIRKGFHRMPEAFSASHGSGKKPVCDGTTPARYTLNGNYFKKVFPNEFLVYSDGVKLMVLDKLKEQQVVAEVVPNYAAPARSKRIGVTPRNLEQELLIHMLMKPELPGVTVAGLAGSGKTYLTLGVALHLILDLRLYRRMIITRAAVGADEDQGFLPGDERAKMAPWMGAVFDNLESLLGIDLDDDQDLHDDGAGFDDQRKDQRHSRKKARGSVTLNDQKGDRETKVHMSWDMVKQRIVIKSLRFMKGRELKDTIIVIDETQDLTAKKTKMIATRVGLGSKIVFLGNSAQIDDSELTEYTCGLSYLIRSFADSKLMGNITLQQGERSPFATEAEQRL